MSDTLTYNETKSSFIATMLAVLGGFAIFLIILMVAYLPNKAGYPNSGSKTPAERKALLAELNGNNQTISNTYGWVDKERGIVRIPLDRAIELTIQEHLKK
jgi:hypothetical protein